MSTGICRWLILLISLSTWITTSNSKEMRVVCYYTNWSVYRPGTAKFSPQNINPYLCTHLIYAFGGFTKENTLKPFDKYQDIEKGGYAKFTGLKTYNKNLKTMLAIGGWNEGSSRFSPMVANPERRKELVKNAIKFLRQNHFDGLDLDWEYPSFRDGGKPRDKDNYALLVKELREEFDRESEKTGRPRLLLTMAVPAGIEYINKGYDIPKLTKYLDWMNILSYDYHSAFEPAVNHHAPLYSLEEESEYNYDTELNIDYTIKHYLKLGADPTKLVMGIPTYGRSYTLFNPDANEIGAPADGPGEMGEATRENGYLAYYEICENVKSQDWEVVQPNPKAMGPYAFKGNQWVGYDDDNIARKKAEYVAENNLGGIMFWAIDNDDFRGNCHGRPYPLIEAAKEALLSAYGITDDNLVSPPAKAVKPKSKTRSRVKEEEKQEETEVAPVLTSTSRRRNRLRSKPKDRDVTTERSKPRRKDGRKTTEITSTYSSLKVITPSYTTPPPPATPDQGGGFKCEDEGFFPHPKDCKKYYWCLGGAGDTGIIAHQFTCPAGLYFNKAADSCDYSQNVLCNKKLAKATTTTEVASIKSTTTTTEKPYSTSRVPPKITAATSKTTLRFTTSTAAPIEDEYEDEEYYDEEEENKKDSEEDPRVIKELIDLIRKAGGIEELEKQLKFDTGQGGTESNKSTKSALSKTLYERVLSKAGKSSTGLKSTKTYTSLNRNSRGPQNDGILKEQEENEKTTSNRGRPKYTSIARQRPSTEKSVEEEIEEENEDEKENENGSKRQFKKPSEQNYVNIRRPKVTSTTEEAVVVNKYNRNKALGESSDEEEVSVTVNTPVSSPQYVNIRRQRPSTTEAPASKYVELRRGSTTPSTSPTEEEVTTRYKTFQRGTTTAANSLLDSETSSKRSRGTTTASTTTTEEGNDNNKLRYKTITRGSTTASISTTESSESSSVRTQTSRPVINIAALLNTPRLPIEDEFSTPNSIITISPESVIINTNSNLLTTKLTSEEPTTTDSKLSIDDIITQINSDTSNEKNTPQLFEPRPFSLNTRGTTPSSIKPFTETSTQITKVSETNKQFRLRPKASNLHDGVVSKQNFFTYENTGTDSRSRSRLNINNHNIDSEDASVTKASIQRSRKRFSTTTQRYEEKEEYDDGLRTFRPSGIDDLSSLTAADIAQINGFQPSNPKRGRPRNGIASTTDNSRSTEGLKATSRTLPSTFGKNKRIFASRNKEQEDTNPNGIKRIRGVHNSTASSSTETPITANNRKVIRRFRPVQRNTTDEQGQGEQKPIVVRQFRRPVSRTRSTTESTISTSKRNENEEVLNETDSDELSVEDGENIKLSESNIRENSELSNNGISSADKPQSISVKLKTDKTGGLHEKTVNKDKVTQSDHLITTVKPTEPNIIVRTRKIIRKIKPTESSLTIAANDTVDLNQNRRRKVVRLYRPANGLNDNSESADKIPKRKKILIRGRPTSSDLEVTTESISKPAVHEKLVESVVKKPLEKSSSAIESTLNNDDRDKNTAQEVDDDDQPLTMVDTTTQSDIHESGTENEHDSSESTTTTTTTTSTSRSTTLQRHRGRPPHIRSKLAEQNETSTTERPHRGRGRVFSTPATEVTTRSRSRTSTRKTTEVSEETTTASTLITTTETDNETTIRDVENSILLSNGEKEETPEITTLENITTTEKEVSLSVNTTIATSSNALVNTTTEDPETSSQTLETTSSLSETSSEDVISPTTSPQPETSSVETTPSRKSTLRPVNSRPRYTPKRPESTSESPSTEASTFRKQNRFNYRKSTTEAAEISQISRVRSTTAVPVNKFIYRYSSTTEESKLEEPEEEIEDEEKEFDEHEEEDIEVSSPRPRGEYKPLSRPKIQRPPKVSNTPINSSLREFNKPQTRRTTTRPTNKPRFTKPTETSSPVPHELIDTDLEAVKNRNKNLFSKKRKMNTPFGNSVTQSTTNLTNTTEELITLAPQLTEPVTKSSVQQTETTEMLTTLHHIFAEIEPNKTANVETSTESVNNSKKVEKLFEVNRIIEIKTKEAFVKNHSGIVKEQTKVEVVPTVDKLGAVSRITVIKVVGGNEIESEHLTSSDNEIKQETTESNDASKVTINIDGAFIIPEIAKVEEVKPFDSNREERRFDILTKGTYNSLSDGKTQLKTEIIDGKSNINIITPRPIYSTEASTIALQGLFQTDTPSGLNKNLLNANEELLETENSRFVNIRILGQHNKVPIIENGDEVTMRAHVVEIPPKPSDRTIKIVPIQVAMSRRLVDEVPYSVQSPFLTKVEAGIPKVDITLLKPESKQR